MQGLIRPFADWSGGVQPGVRNLKISEEGAPLGLYDAPDPSSQIACSIGVVMHPLQGEPDKLIANADVAMYAAKRAGGSSDAFFESHMAVDTADQLQLQSDLRLALESNQFELYYQP